MNLITSNCTGAFVYRDLGTFYNNPFMWSLIYFDDFLYLINNFDSIDFENISVSLEQFEEDIKPPRPKSILVNIDNKLTVHYIHNLYLGDEKRLLEEFKEKYNRRLARMYKDKEEPLFMYVDDYKENADLLRFSNIDKDLIILTRKEITFDNPKIKVLNLFPNYTKKVCKLFKKSHSK